jgi:hypothetical protein
LTVGVAATALVALFSAQPVRAGALSLSLKDGRVTILAYNVSVREILNEWARLGGVSITGSDALGGAPISVELKDVPESKALEVLLRSARGYVALSRNQPAATGSMFQSIRILSTSRAPALPPPVMAQAPAPAQPQSFAPPTVAPMAPPFTPPVASTAPAGGAAMGQAAGSNVAFGDAAGRFAPLTPVEQAGLRQNQQALQDFLVRANSRNSAPPATPAASTDAGRPGSITPYTPPSGARPASPQVPPK